MSNKVDATIGRTQRGFVATLAERDSRQIVFGGAISCALLAAAPFFLDTYTINILIRALFLAALALTVDILWGYMGVLTFGQSAFFGIGAYACALTFSHYGFGAGWALGAVFIGIITAMAVAALVGWLAFYHGASPLYGSIVTLALPIVLTQVVYSGGNFTGRSGRISNLLLGSRNLVLARRRLFVSCYSHVNVVR